MTATCRGCEPWAPSEACPVHGDEEHRVIPDGEPCPRCNREVLEGERHGEVDDLEVSSDGSRDATYVCLDSEGEVLEVLCPRCELVPREEERHLVPVGDGGGEPVDWTCLDSEGSEIPRPSPPAGTVVPDPWQAMGPVPPPPF